MSTRSLFEHDSFEDGTSVQPGTYNSGFDRTLKIMQRSERPASELLSIGGRMVRNPGINQYAQRGGCCDHDNRPQAQPVQAPRPVHTDAPDWRQITAKFPGSCSVCRGRYQAGETIMHRPGQGKHVECPQTVTTPQRTAGDDRWERDQAYIDRHPEFFGSELRTPVTAVVSTRVDDGTYTIVLANGHRTICLETQAADAEFAAGEQLISLLTGPDNSSDFTSFGIVKPDGRIIFWRKHRGPESVDFRGTIERALSLVRAMDETGREHAGLEYAIRSSRCRRCHRTLTVPSSVHQGYGPECVKKVAGI